MRCVDGVVMVENDHFFYHDLKVSIIFNNLNPTFQQAISRAGDARAKEKSFQLRRISPQITILYIYLKKRSRISIGWQGERYKCRNTPEQVGFVVG